MIKRDFEVIEAHMLSLMSDAAHDSLHIYRVLYMAMDIAAHEQDADMDVLITACLLHDIGRDAQYKNPALCHAREGAAMAYSWLMENGWPGKKASHVRDCIATHRYRSNNPPITLEAKILFDADKLDATGALAVARTFFYSAAVGEPLYILDEKGHVLIDPVDEPSSFLQEYNFKLRHVYDKFQTQRGRELAEKRREAGDAFYEAMLREVSQAHMGGRQLLRAALSTEEEINES